MELLGFITLIFDCLVTIILVFMAVKNRKVAWFLLALALGLYPLLETTLRVFQDAWNVRFFLILNVIESPIKQFLTLLGVSLLFFETIRGARQTSSSSLN
jgi:uncharacterized membrane protein YhfC